MASWQNGFLCSLVLLTVMFQTTIHTAFGYALNNSWWSDLGDYSYRLIATNVSWVEARRECASFGTTLPIFRKDDDLYSMMQHMKERNLSSIAVGIAGRNGSFYFIDNGDSVPCRGWNAHTSALANATFLALSLENGYVDIGGRPTNAVCQMFRSSGPDVLPCARLSHVSQPCGRGSWCHSARIVPDSQGDNQWTPLGYAFTSHSPGRTLAITDMISAGGNSTSVIAVNPLQVDLLLRLGFVYGSVIGYVLASPQGVPCALSIRLCWNDPHKPTTSLFTFRKCYGGWTEMGIVHTLCTCYKNCCVKLVADASAINCDIVTSTTSTIATTSTSTSTSSTKTTSSSSTRATETTSTHLVTTRTSASTTHSSSTITTTNAASTTPTSTVAQITTKASTSTPFTTEVTTTSAYSQTSTTTSATAATTQFDTTTASGISSSTEAEPPFPHIILDSRLETLVNILSGFGSVIVIGTMSSIIVIFLLLKDFSTERVIHLNQEVALILANVIIITVMKRRKDNIVPCASAAVGLQCLFYAYFSLLLLESIHVYAILTNVGHQGGIFPRTDSIVVAWTVPVIVTAACARPYFYDYPSRMT